MARYIDADKLDELIENRKTKGDCKFCNKYERCIKNGINRKGSHLYCWEKLELPTADVEEVKRGYWKMEYHETRSTRGRLIRNKTFTCSNCNRRNGRITTKYCPNCGAKMDGGKAE